MSTWISEKKLTWYESLCMNVLKAGHVPKHVAFIMDGNRRFAKRNHLEKVEGHARGFSKLSETLKWCRDLGVTEVTVYAFSIENFRRPRAEIDGIMDLAREKFQLLLKEKEKLMEHGVCIRFIGDLSLVPDDIQRLIAEVMVMTRHNKAARLNIAFSYTAREEISRAVRDVADGVAAGRLAASDVSERLIEQCLYTRDSPRPDLLVRTSGEVRLSDFLLWQTTHTCIFFTEVLWPDFTIWHLFAGVFEYQRNYHAIQRARSELSSGRLQHRTDILLSDGESASDSGDSTRDSSESGDSAAESADSLAAESPVEADRGAARRPVGDSSSHYARKAAAGDSADSARGSPTGSLDSCDSAGEWADSLALGRSLNSALASGPVAAARVEAFLTRLDAHRWGRLESLLAHQAEGEKDGVKAVEACLLKS